MTLSGSRHIKVMLYQPTKAGPIIRNSLDLNPFSPVPTKNIIDPRDTVPKPGNKYKGFDELNQQMKKRFEAFEDY